MEFTAMNLKEAKEYLNEYFKYNSELLSFSHELTDDGVINRSHLALLTNEEVINVASDAQYEVRCSYDGLI